MIINETEHEIRRASERLYVALSSVLNGDLGLINEIWS